MPPLIPRPPQEIHPLRLMRFWPHHFDRASVDGALHKATLLKGVLDNHRGARVYSRLRTPHNYP